MFAIQTVRKKTRLPAKSIKMPKNHAQNRLEGNFFFFSIAVFSKELTLLKNHNALIILQDSVNFQSFFREKIKLLMISYTDFGSICAILPLKNMEFVLCIIHPLRTRLICVVISD